MTIVSFSSGQTYRHCHSSQHGSDEEGSCSDDGGDIVGYEYLNGVPSDSSVAIDSEREATMYEDDEDVVDGISSSFTFKAGAIDNQPQQRIYRQTQQYANLVICYRVSWHCSLFY